jgi:hypothetical protein
MTEEVQKDEGAKEVKKTSNEIPVSPYSNIKREITEEDLKFPVIQRILLSEVDKLERKNSKYEDILKSTDINFNKLKDEFHEKDKQKDILEEKLKSHKSQEILYSFCLTSGSIMIGLSKQVWNEGLGGVFIGIGLFLIIGGIISKAVKWN